MEKDLGDVQALVAGGQLEKVTAWLREHIHRHASFHKPDKLFEMTCGKFDAGYFTNYLRSKYGKLYEL
jgi:carboxypeptidase Taq